MSEQIVMSPQRVKRTINRLVFEIIERNKGAENLILFGIYKSGLSVASVLANGINAVEKSDIVAYSLDTSGYRDDRPADDRQAIQLPEIDVTNRDLVLVDDVLFTGRTVRAALDAIIHLGRPKSIQLAVLVDRGHREYPIQADYVGLTLPTKDQEKVIVQTDGDMQVVVAD